MLNYLTSFGASSTFQKNRLIITARTLQAPNQSALKKILKTFQGQDQQTRAQIAYATIVKKIMTSDSNTSWIYLLKNLIILDRILQDTCFIQQIADLKLPVIDSFYETDSKYTALRTCETVRNYWKLIKANAIILATKNNIMCFSRSQRSEFLNTLTPVEVIKQIEPIENLFNICFMIINLITSKQGVSQAMVKAISQLEKSSLMSYLLLQIMYKLVSYYSSEMLCVNKIVYFLAKDDSLEIISLEAIRNFRQKLLRFKGNSIKIIAFLQQNKQIKGFQVVNYHDLDPMPQNHLLKSIDKYISERMNFDQNTKNVYQYVPQGGKSSIAVRLKPKLSGPHSYSPTQPRKAIKIVRQKQEKQKQNNPFNNWISNYSEDFPQKQVMTLDLIMTLKKQKQSTCEAQRQTNYQEAIIYNERQTCTFPSQVAQLPQNIHFQTPDKIQLSKQFNSIYSGGNLIWNYQQN